jgi:hypothetical protein
MAGPNFPNQVVWGGPPFAAGTNPPATVGVLGRSGTTAGQPTPPNNTGVAGTSTGSYGVVGICNAFTGVYGEGSTGVAGYSTNDTGVVGRSGNAAPPPPGSAGVSGTSSIGPGVLGITSSNNGRGVQGNSTSGPGVDGTSTSSFGVQGTSRTLTGVRGRNIGGGTGVYGSSGGGGTGPYAGIGVQGFSVGVRSYGVRGVSDDWVGVVGATITGNGVEGASGSGIGGLFASNTSMGVYGRCGGFVPIPFLNNGGGVVGTSTVPGGAGVRGRHTGSDPGVAGYSGGGNGVYGEGGGTNSGVYGYCVNGTGAYGVSASGTGVQGTSTGGIGVAGVTSASVGVQGTSTHGDGVSGKSTNGDGVSGNSSNGAGVSGVSFAGPGVFGKTTGRPIDPDPGVKRVAGFFDGGLKVINGDKDFTIDHPLDPRNKYLVHTCIESSERKNVYDGVALLDRDGAVWVELPEWFEALNGDFRYQLTAVGGAAPDLHVAEEISENRFKIAGGEEGMKVCWQVTGCRRDPWAAANPFEVELEKREQERGRYLEPSVYGAPEEQRVMIVPVAEAPIAEAVAAEEQAPEPSDIDLVGPEEEHIRRINESLGSVDELRREIEELRRAESQEEAETEST